MVYFFFNFIHVFRSILFPINSSVFFERLLLTLFHLILFNTGTLKVIVWCFITVFLTTETRIRAPNYIITQVFFYSHVIFYHFGYVEYRFKKKYDCGLTETRLNENKLCVKILYAIIKSRLFCKGLYYFTKNNSVHLSMTTISCV